LGSFSKILAPGLRLGYAVAPTAVYGKLVQAKQAADLHSGTFAQHVVADLLGTGMLEIHLNEVRTLYRRRRDAMAHALQVHMRDLATWHVPEGGMFFWLTLAHGIDAGKLLPVAVERGVSFVPGAAFFAGDPMHHAMRLSFATESAERIAQGVTSLAGIVRQAAEAQNN
jgi:2-aminoadipate transaminase